MTNSIFEPKKGKRTTKKIPVVVSLELAESIEEVQRALKERSPELSFNVNRLCEEALEVAVKKAKRELARMGSG